MARIILSRFRVVDYRSCKDTEITFDRKLTALIGPNGVGKTNILQAIVLFGQPGGSISSAEDTNSQQCTVEVDFVRAKKPVRYRGTVTYRTGADNRDEALGFDERWNFVDQNSSKSWLSIDRLRASSNRSRASLLRLARRSSLDWKQANLGGAKNLDLDANAKRYARVADEVAEFASKITYYSASQFTNPAASPTSFEINERGKLSRTVNSRNLVHQKFLHDLYTASQDRIDLYDLFLSFVDKRGLGLVNGFSWRSAEFVSETHSVASGGKVERQKKKRILIIPTVKIGSSRLSFNQLSEGTFRTLALVFYVITNESLLLIEEPEVCVHHGLLNSVVSILKEFSRTKQIIFSTHSEAVLDRLAPEQLRLVSCNQAKGTVVQDVMSALSDEKLNSLKSYLATAGSLGEFWRSSGFD
ncbi:hypothetical protein BRAS3809_6620002 [Bradyrhizobium sp. STM 3809]|nr:hypothetical protein BRAS3809_6620002 [Bradyrhizobium sp. STM 3809]